MDAITVRAGAAILAAGSLTLAIATHDTEALPSEQTPLILIPPPIPTFEERAVMIANDRFADHHRFEVFSSESLGSLYVVFAQRSTGDCGGCGALVVAVLFDGDRILISELGEYGRFGKGPDRIELVNVTGGRNAGATASPIVEKGEVKGLRLRGVRPTSAAGQLGLRSGDTISAIDGDNIKTMDQMLELYGKLDRLGGIELQGTRGGKPLSVQLRFK